MQTYKLTIQYEGTNYQGWQKQKRLDAPTIQEHIEIALSDLLNHDTSIVGAGRTDSGVHALAQTASFRAETKIPPDSILRALNVRLPEDIAITDVAIMPDNFHAQKDAKAKHYRYYVYADKIPRTIGRQYFYQTTYPLSSELLNESIPLLEGTHDFSAFCASGSDVLTKERTIYKINLTRHDKWWIFDYYGAGFLRNMVRIMTGSLLEIAACTLDPLAISQALATGKRELLGRTAPACGLWLMQVYY